jgi:UDP-glucuronate decarboxylase
MSGIALITGGAGFIGSHLCERVLEERPVICIDNLSSGTERNIAQLQTYDQFQFVEHDVKDDIYDRLATEGVEVDDISQIYHLASRASPVDFDEYPLDILRTSSRGTDNVFKLARKINARVLLASTSEVYGNPEVHPQPESYNGNVDMRGARSCYDEGKRFIESLAVAFIDQYDIDIRTVRPFNTYGPRMRGDDGRVIPNFITQSAE